MFVVCGEALYDVFAHGEGPVSGLKLEARAGGSPFNVAIGLARLGTRTALLTSISRDMLGERLVERLAREGVATGYLVRSGRRTTLSVVSVGAEGGPSYSFYGVGSADCSLTDADMPALGADVWGLHFGSYSIAVAPTADAFAALAEREAHRLVSLDPNVRLAVEPDVGVWTGRIARLLRIASVVKVSTEDLAALCPGRPPDAIAREWLAAGPALVVVTDGASGASAWTATVQVSVAAATVDVVDTVGAGDAFQAALLWQLGMQGITSRSRLAALDAGALHGLLTVATRAAAITIARRGADLPRAEELD